MIKFFSTAAELTLLVAVPIFASHASAQDRKQDQDACGRDATRLCKAVIHNGDFAILDCLKTNRAKLRPVCLKFLQEKGQL